MAYTSLKTREETKPVLEHLSRRFRVSKVDAHFVALRYLASQPEAVIEQAIREGLAERDAGASPASAPAA
jgi:predicted transcriptional regulator